jgi:hypothetical protein
LGSKQALGFHVTISFTGFFSHCKRARPTCHGRRAAEIGELTRPARREEKRKKERHHGPPVGSQKRSLAGRTYPRPGVPVRPPAGGGRYGLLDLMFRLQKIATR